MFEDIIKEILPKKKEPKEKKKEWPALSKNDTPKKVWKILWKKSIQDDLRRAYES